MTPYPLKIYEVHIMQPKNSIGLMFLTEKVTMICVVIKSEIQQVAIVCNLKP